MTTTLLDLAPIPLACALGLALALPFTPDHEVTWELRQQGTLNVPRGGRSSALDLRANNPASATRLLVVTFAAPCDSSSLSVRIANHHGKAIYDGDVTCSPFRVPVPAGQFADIHLYGRGGYDVTLTFR
ncbi:MAG: hypothetical protein M4D80_26455 [Myxococcota bacterium]|nr:hypothetical protein [Deltaproteobacteria bacterium]MDQ3338723.1 hypothetical protein [Myxococcota bacterium]